ncbi:EpsG family protein [Flavobacterium davisii]|uniref:EpsG family protein n=1 Tax=Flavobacterium davisii TaxID=2906077 RepID=UPI0035CECCD5
MQIGYVIFIIMLIAFRPIGENGFTDTLMYMKWFDNSREGFVLHKDIGFDFLIYCCAQTGSYRALFFMCSLISFVFLIWICYTIANDKWFLMFLVFLVSIYFWNHQVFTIRQGMASIFFIAGVLHRNNLLKIFLILLAVSFHISFLMPLIVYVLVLLFQNTIVYLIFWFLVIILSMLGKMFFFGEIVNFFLSERISYYIKPLYDSDKEVIFRWDVIIYSFVFIVIGIFYNYKFYHNQEKEYGIFLNIFLLTNSIFLLVVPFSSDFAHRFAYLSWFIIPLIVFFPLFKSGIRFNFKLYLYLFILFYGSITSYVFLKIHKQGGKYVVEQNRL